MRRDVRTVANWDFDRIIPCHGVSRILVTTTVAVIERLPFYQDVIETGGKKAWEDVYKLYLD